MKAKSTAKAPGVSSTIVKGPNTVAGLGKSGSAKSKTKGVKDKAGKFLIG